jgi:hypothetical protein
MVARSSSACSRTCSRKACGAASFRSDLDTRLAVLGILGMANAVANWYRSEDVRSSASAPSSPGSWSTAWRNARSALDAAGAAVRRLTRPTAKF